MASINKAPSSSEESSWTKYFEDFFDNNNHKINEDNECSMSFSANEYSSSSLVSDAASLAAPKMLLTNYCSKQGEEYRNESRFFKKRKKIKTALIDDALEDTASSPVNSLKVLYDENQLCKAKQKEEIDLFREKGNNTSGERDEQKDFNERDSDCTDLKKKGLRLVPLSMVVK